MGARLRYLLPLLAAAVPAGPAAAQQPPAAAPAADLGKRVVAYLHGTVPITREELGDYLIARGGMDRLDILINRRLVELEAAKRGVTVTPLEVAAGFNDDLHTAGLTRADFVSGVLPRYGKTMFEWEQDVVRQRLLMSKMARDRVKVTDDDLRKAFEAKYGERREAFVIQWPKGKDGLSDEVKKIALENQAQFEQLAAKQPNDLQKTGGRIEPIGRYIDGEDPRVEAALFALKNPGDAVWVETEAMSTGLRLIRVVPPDANVKFEQVKAALEKDLFDRRLSAELPKLFVEIHKAANPTLTVHVPARPGADPKEPAAPRAPHPDPKVLAVLYGNIPVTRLDLGDFLIARGGYEKLESLVNVRIVELEAAKRNVAATPEEIEATLLDNLKAIGEGNVTKDDFVRVLLPRVGKTLAEYTEDEVRPKILLSKMCRDKVAVTPEEVRKEFDRQYGEKRKAKIILWGPGEFRRSQREWDEARKSDAEFDRIARMQADPNLAGAAGEVRPIGRNGDAPNPLIEKVVFDLQPGEVSQLFQTPAGILCVKCTGVIPPAQGVTPEAVKGQLEKAVFDQKLSREVAALFASLRTAANPNLILRGPPTDRENEEGVRQILHQAGVPVPRP